MSWSPCPEIWLDVDTMADLGDVAADFRARHGRRLRHRHQILAPDAAVLLRASTASSSTASSKASAPPKARPPPAQADIIVDITSTGSTLKANHLKILSDGVILKSEACLVRARKAGHVDDPVVAKIIEAVQGAVA